MNNVEQIILAAIGEALGADAGERDVESIAKKYAARIALAEMTAEAERLKLYDYDRLPLPVAQ